jgi:hypothetical protein
MKTAEGKHTINTNSVEATDFGHNSKNYLCCEELSVCVHAMGA